MRRNRTAIFRSIILCYFFSLTAQAMPNAKGQYGIGSTSFEELRFSPFYVDKTMLIHELIVQDAKVTLITYPRRWGKSANVFQVATYCSHLDPEEGKRIFKGTNILKCKTCQQAQALQGKIPVILVDFSHVTTDSYEQFLNDMRRAIAKPFKHHHYLKNLLNDKTESEDLRKFEGYLSKKLPEDVSQTKKIEYLIKRRDSLEKNENENQKLVEKKSAPCESIRQEALDRKRQVTRVVNITKEEQKKQFEDIDALYEPLLKVCKPEINAAKIILKEIKNKLKATEIELAWTEGNFTRRFEDHIKESLKFLSEVIERKTGEKPIILIDEYDRPINDVFLRPGGKELLDMISRVMRGLMQSTFKSSKDAKDKVTSDPPFRFGVITGILRIARENMFSGVNNLVEHNMLKSAYFKYYGLTKEEIQGVIDRNPTLKSSSLTVQNLEDWFDGYKVPDDPNLDIYNPWSVILSMYWKSITCAFTESGFMTKLQPLFLKDEILPTIKHLLKGGVVTLKTYDLYFNLNDLNYLRDMLHERQTILPNGRDLFLRLLVTSGYLALNNDNKTRKQGKWNMNIEKNQAEKQLKIPNWEIRTYLANLVTEYYMIQNNIDDVKLNAASHALYNLFGSNHTENFRVAFQEFLKGFKKLTRKSGGSGIHFNEKFIYSLIDFVIFNKLAGTSPRKSIEFAATEVRYNDERMKALNCGLVRKDIKTGMVIELKDGLIEEMALDQAQKYFTFFEKFDYVEVVQFVGVSCSINYTVQVKTKIVGRQK